MARDLFEFKFMYPCARRNLSKVLMWHNTCREESLREKRRKQRRIRDTSRGLSLRAMAKNFSGRQASYLPQVAPFSARLNSPWGKMRKRRDTYTGRAIKAVINRALKGTYI